MKKNSLVRVTTVLDFVESKWKEYWWRKVGFEEADKISRESAGFGTSVHDLIESALKGEAVEIDSEEQAHCANQIIEYIQQNDIKPLFETFEKSLEIEVKDTALGLVGHFDFAALVNGEPYIIDFKTSGQMRKSFPLQKSAYAKMVKKQFGVEIQKGLTLRSHWDRQQNKFEFEDKEYEDLLGTYWPKFKSCLDVYQYFNGKD